MLAKISLFLFYFCFIIIVSLLLLVIIAVKYYCKCPELLASILSFFLNCTSAMETTTGFSCAVKRRIQSAGVVCPHCTRMSSYTPYRHYLYSFIGCCLFTIFSVHLRLLQESQSCIVSRLVLCLNLHISVNFANSFEMN